MMGFVQAIAPLVALVLAIGILILLLRGAKSRDYSIGFGTALITVLFLVLAFHRPPESISDALFLGLFIVAIFGPFFVFVISVIRRKTFWDLLKVFILVLFFGLFSYLSAGSFIIAKQQALLAGCESNLKSIASAVDKYGEEHAIGKDRIPVYPESLKQIPVTYFHNHLSHYWPDFLPLCPRSAPEPYVYQLQRNIKGEVIGYVIKCPHPERHQYEWIPPRYVKDLFYSSKSGLQVIRE